MIRVNDKEFTKRYFPDGTQQILDFNPVPNKFCIPGDVNATVDLYTFEWRYENDEELITLMYLVNHLRNLYPHCRLNLIMNYVPNARMDRVKSKHEVFTLKWFCNIINSLKFDSVTVLDPHSHVCEGLLDHLIIDEYQLEMKLKYVLKECNADLIYFPDAGALKRYGDLSVFNGIKKVYGKKNRDWETGKILGLSILSDEGDPKVLVKNSTSILMVDDIIAYGGTLYYSTLELRKLGAQEISAYVSHTENSILDKEYGAFIQCLENNRPDFESRRVNMLYTSNSLFKLKHPKIKVLPYFSYVS